MKVKEILWSKRGKMWVTLFARRSTCWNITRRDFCVIWVGVCIEKQGDTLCCCTLGTQLLLRGGKRERERGGRTMQGGNAGQGKAGQGPVALLLPQLKCPSHSQLPLSHLGILVKM